VAGDTLLKFFFGEMLDELREDGASRVHPSLFHPVDRRKEVNPALSSSNRSRFNHELSAYLQ
jgi:hypothetical protein